MARARAKFYTTAEVSRIIAQILGIRSARISNDTTVYDPTCGSGSLLLKVADEARTPVTLYGQEKDAATAGLARMNMILHNNPTALIVQGNTLARSAESTAELESYKLISGDILFSHINSLDHIGKVAASRTSITG